MLKKIRRKNMEPSTNCNTYSNYNIQKEASSASLRWNKAISELEKSKNLYLKLDTALNAIQGAINIFQGMNNYYDETFFYSKKKELGQLVTCHYACYDYPRNDCNIKKLKGCLNLLKDEKPDLDLVINILKGHSELPIPMTPINSYDDLKQFDNGCIVAFEGGSNDHSASPMHVFSFKGSPRVKYGTISTNLFLWSENEYCLSVFTGPRQGHHLSEILNDKSLKDYPLKMRKATYDEIFDLKIATLFNEILDYRIDWNKALKLGSNSI